MTQQTVELWGLFLRNAYSVCLLQRKVCGCEYRCKVCHIGEKESRADAWSIYQSTTMLWFFTPCSTANQVFPILTAQCAEEGIHLSSSAMGTINTKQCVLELSSSDYDPFVCGLLAKLPLDVLKHESKNLVRKISFRVWCNL